METPIIEKKKRGNPNFQKKKNNTPLPNEENKTNMDDNVTGTEEQVIPSNEEGKKLPDNLFSDEIGAEVKPMDGPVKEKAYASLPNEVEEQPAASSDASSAKTDAASSSATESTPATPAAKTALSPEEINNQAAQTADLLIQGYDKLHMLGRYVGKIDDNELMMLHEKGQIDLNFELPLGTQKIVTRDFFQGYNAGIDESIIVTQDFKDKIRPPLVRVCVKHGWLMNDEMYIMTVLAEDVATKVSMLVGLKKSCGLVLNACMEIMKAQKANGGQKTEQTSFTETPGPDGPADDSWREQTA